MLIYENPKTRPGIYQGKIGGFFIQVTIKKYDKFFCGSLELFIGYKPRNWEEYGHKEKCREYFQNIAAGYYKSAIAMWS